MVRIAVFALVAFVASSFSTAALALNGLTYQGRIIRADGSPIESPNVTVTVQIKSPGSENCLLFQETHSLDMTNSKGVFSLSIGAGTRVSSSIDGGFSMAQIFANRAVAIGPLPACDFGSTYTPNTADSRKLIISFNDGSGVQTLESQTMAFVPYSIEANQISGFDANHLLRVDGTIATPLNAAEYTELTKLIGGLSTQYTKSNQLGGANLPALTNGQSLRWNGSAWEGFSAGTVVNSIQAGTGLSANGTAGGTLTSSGTLALTATGVTPGTYGAAAAIPQLQIDAQGRVVSASEVALTSVASFSGNLAGDVTGTQTGTSVDRIRGTRVSTTTPATDQVLKFDGTEWSPSVLAIADVRNSMGIAQIPLTCTSGETMTWDSINDKLVCSPISLAAATLTSAQVTDALTYTPVNKAGDTMSGALALPSGGLSVGTSELTVVGGNVGVNTAAPQTKLDVSGAVRFGMDATACSATIAGAQRYNGGVMEYCNGTSWIAYGASGAGVMGLSGDVSASGSGTVVATVNQVGGVSAADLASGANLANAATDSNTASSIVKRDASGNFTAGTVTANLVGNVAGTLTGNVATLTTKGDLLSSDGTANTRLAVGTDGQILSADSTQPSGLKWTANLAGAATDANVASAIVKRDASGNFAAGTITAASFVGTLTGTATNTTQIQGQPVDSTAPSGAGQLLRWDGSKYTATNLKFEDLKSAASLTQFPTTCTTSQVMIYSSLSDTYECQNIMLADSTSIMTGDVTGSIISNTVSKIQNRDVSNSAPSNGNVLAWNGTAWAPTPAATGTLTGLTGDVTASGTGSVSATVAQVGGVTASNVAAGANLANAATSVNTASTIVKRDASGNFAAGTITANLTGNVTGNLTGNVTGNLTGNVAGNLTGNVTGGLTAPTNGLIVGTTQLVASGGYVGIGTASPSNALDVQGSIRARIYDNGSSRTIDWALGNVQYTTAGCDGTNFTMNNLLDGGSYTLILKASSHSGLCAFTGSSVTNWRFRPAAYQPSGYVVLTFLKAGADVFIAWSDSY